MASIPCTGVAAAAAAITSKSFPSSTKFNTRFVGTRNRLGWVRPLGLGPSNGSRAKCWFKFGKNGVDAEGAGGEFAGQGIFMNRLKYFNYMGMLAVEGTYDKMNALLSQNIHPVDILLLMAASEGDKPKIEELLRAGASYSIKDVDGRTALDRAASGEIKDFILGFSVQKA
ncbi:PREDICTED: LHCP TRANSLOCATION DEFECT [Prunus dulcis]|uniref:Protein LHCP TRANSLOCATION DEFECT n=1 Tax=Prunus dulcis TaxID=3755 RepID=A0A5E4G6K1_PRUDU|nr:PREDICTED: LHCP TRANSLOCATION DEFECT [Prunus dulcis]